MVEDEKSLMNCIKRVHSVVVIGNMSTLRKYLMEQKQ